MTPLAHIAQPVTVICAAAGGRRSCATGTVTYLSLDPPLVGVSHRPGGTTTGLIEAAGEFSVSLLGEAQLDVAGRAGRPSTAADKLADAGIEPLDPPDGLTAPGLAGSLAVLWCRVVDRRPVGDHVLFVGEVVASAGGEPDAPLLRHRRRYRAGGAWLSEESPEGYPL